ncbi:MAG: hypothetical protein ACI4Q3_10770 [Kiritimatiellia bacterium]
MKFLEGGFLVVAFGLLTSVAWADVLFYDGFVVGEGGYTTDSVNGNSGDALSGKSSAASTGFSGNWQGATATVKMSQTGLAMPQTSYHGQDGGSLLLNYENNGYRALSHQLADMPSTGTVYFMTLMKCESGAMTDYGTGDMALLGVKPGNSIDGTLSGVQALQAASGFWFGFMKSDGKVYPVVKVNDSVTPFSSQVAQMDATYICEGRIEYGAGADGADRLSWNVRTIDEWDAAETKEAWAGTKDVTLGKLTYLSVSYLIQTKGHGIWFDEVRAATTYGECVGRHDLLVATGLPGGYRAASGTFTAMANAGETVTAPEFVNPDVTERTLRCCGYVIEKKVGADWQMVESVVTRAHAFTVPEAWRSTPDVLRLTWQWDESPRLVSCTGDPVLISDLFKVAGYVGGTNAIPDSDKLNPYALARNVHYDAGGRLFDGLTWYVGTKDARVLGYMTREGGSDVTLNVPADVLSGDELLLCEYRLSPVSYWSNLQNRMPTAWTLSVSNVATAASGWTVADAQSGVDVSRVPTGQDFPQSQEEAARFDYPLETPVPFTSVKFWPTDSIAYQTNLVDGTSVIDWGLLEIALLVRRANPKGTLRVSVPGIGSDGFSDGDRALLTAAATLTAPAEAVALDGKTSYLLTGWVLETFDETTGLWTVVATGTEASYDWTPDADVRARLTWLYDRDAPKYKVTGVSERTSDTGLVGTWIKEDVSVAPAAEGGYYARGTEVTVTATPDTTDFSKGGITDQRNYQSRFVRWIGDTDGLDVDLTSPSITFAVDRPRALLAVFDRNWLVVPNGGDPIIHNANWRFQVSYDTSRRTVTVKNWTRGSGRLNFDTPVYDQDGHLYSITIFGDEVAAYTGGNRKTVITELILPKTLVQLGGQCFRMNLITNLVMDCPVLVSVGAATLARNYDLAKAVVNIPSVKSITSYYPFYNWPCTDTDLSTWNISSLTNIPYQMLCQQNGIDRAQAHACQSGALAFPRAQSIAGCAFENFAQAAEFHLGTADAKLGAIEDGAFGGCAATNFVIGCTRSITVGATAFQNHLSGGPEAFRFIAAAPAEKAVLENFLASNSSNHMAKVYVSRIRNEDWSNYVTRVDDIADAAVQAQAVALGAGGAFQTDAGEWKAFVFAQRMPFDPNGTYIIVR